MKICDGCGQRDEKHKEVGTVSINYSGFHVLHWSHRNKTTHWTMDLCPTCGGELKDNLDAFLKNFLNLMKSERLG